MKTNDNIWTPWDICGCVWNKDAPLAPDCTVQLPVSLARELHFAMLTDTIRDGVERDCTILYDRETEEYRVAYSNGQYSRARRPVGIARTRAEDYALNPMTFSPGRHGSLRRQNDAVLSGNPASTVPRRAEVYRMPRRACPSYL
jgi:hypothetical protein